MGASSAEERSHFIKFWLEDVCLLLLVNTQRLPEWIIEIVDINIIPIISFSLLFDELIRTIWVHYLNKK